MPVKKIWGMFCRYFFSIMLIFSLENDLNILFSALGNLNFYSREVVSLSFQLADTPLLPNGFWKKLFVLWVLVLFWFLKLKSSINLTLLPMIKQNLSFSVVLS